LLSGEQKKLKFDPVWMGF